MIFFSAFKSNHPERKTDAEDQKRRPSRHRTEAGIDQILQNRDIRGHSRDQGGRIFFFFFFFFFFLKKKKKKKKKKIFCLPDHANDHGCHGSAESDQFRLPSGDERAVASDPRHRSFFLDD